MSTTSLSPRNGRVSESGLTGSFCRDDEGTLRRFLHYLGLEALYMDAGGSQDASVEKSKITPKAVIHQKFGRTAIYRVEEVQITADNVCLGLAIAQQGPNHYRCTLELPGLCVTSELCKRKKDAEQSAAEKAMEKLDIHLEGHSGNDERDPWNSMVARINHFLSDEFLSTLHPVSSHFRASCHGGRGPKGAIPISILPAYDTKINNICKSVCSEVELNPFFAVFIVMRAVAKLFGSLSPIENQFWLQGRTAFPSMDNNEPGTQENIRVGAIYIPDSLEKSVELLSILISSNEYYLDCIARNLGVSDAYKVTLSRPMKSSSELRLYYVIPTWWQYDASSDCIDAVKAVPSDAPLNMRASYLSGQCIYGNAILASIGYVWHLNDLQHETISLHTYYRLLVGKMPSGIYKLSRESLLASELPIIYTTRSNWRGCSPRQILSGFCTRHRLPEPVFTIHRGSGGTPTEEPRAVSKRLKLEDAGEEEITASIRSDFRCEIKVLSRNGDAIIAYSKAESHRKEDTAIHRAALDVVKWMNGFFTEADTSLEELRDAGRARGIELSLGAFMGEFCLSLLARGMKSQMSFFTGNEAEGSLSFRAEGAAATAAPPSGSMVTVDYAASVVVDGGGGGDVVEKKHGFQFEMGTGSVLPFVESAVSRLCPGRSCFFRRVVPPSSTGLLHAAAPPDVLVSPSWSLEYRVHLVAVAEALDEDRLEQAFFSPPLSRQRLEFALHHIKESRATTLIDFGCGSGSLLVSLLDYPSTLERITGVDISQKGLVRAAKSLHLKLGEGACETVKSVVLYEGSILEGDCRLCGCDIGTCLEVIEHMKEDEATVFGRLALGFFKPEILIISTPNYEYNAILNGGGSSQQPGDGFKFRNGDHKFEWTREEFRRWATCLASSAPEYDVHFSGVGGDGAVDPGFASQIAIFRRPSAASAISNGQSQNTSSYKTIWEWTPSIVS